jgi:SOS response associated peptidase (SRAP)
VRIHNLFCFSASGPLDPLLWGLIPFWCSNPKGGPKPINAKSETVASDWSAIVRRRRCVLRSNRYVAIDFEANANFAEQILSHRDCIFDPFSRNLTTQGTGGTARKSFHVRL